MKRPTAPPRLAEIVGAFSCLTSLADGFAADKALRTSLLAVALARRAGWSGEALSDLYYAATLRFSGCTGFAVEDTRLNAGDDIGLRRTMATADMGDPAQFVATVQTGIGAHLPGPEREARVAAMLADPALGIRHARGQCDAAVYVARAFGMGPAVLAALDHKEERWDGRGIPDGVAGDALSPLARVIAVADFAEMYHRIGGRREAVELLRHRRAAQFDPAWVDLLLGGADELFPVVEAGAPWSRWLDAEPAPRRIVGLDELGPLAIGLARFTDLKSAWFLGHSEAVARLAARVAPRLGLDPARLTVAARLHDLGRAGVSNLVWDKPGPLDAAERAEAERHGTLGAELLSRSPLLAPFAPIVANIHTAAGRPGPEARLLAAVDAWVALTADRPWRPALPPADAARTLEAEARAGRFDPEMVAAVVAAGGEPPRRMRWPGGLTHREVEVLRRVAAGDANKEIAGRLGLSEKTVERHVTRLYARIGARSRAAAALWAVDHGVV